MNTYSYEVKYSFTSELKIKAESQEAADRSAQGLKGQWIHTVPAEMPTEGVDLLIENVTPV